MFNLIVGIILAILLPLTAYLLHREVTFFQRCEIVAGKVTNLKSRTSKGSLSYAPDIALTLPNGHQTVYSHDVYSKPAAFSVGDLVPMGCVDSDVRIMRFANRFGLSLTLGTICFGILLFLVGRSVFDANIQQRISHQLQLESSAR
jgi:hypothetical protein